MATHAISGLDDTSANPQSIPSHTSTSLSSSSPNCTPAPVSATADDLAQLHVNATSQPEVIVTDLSTAKPTEKLGVSPRIAPLPLTGAAVMAEVKRRKQQQQQAQQQQQQQREGSKTPVASRHTSPNPAIAAMQSLMGVTGMSKPTDAPAPDKMSEPLRKAAEKIHISAESNPSVDSEQVSPTSLGSFGTLEHTTSGQSMTVTANDSLPATSHFVAEPAQMTEALGFPINNGHLGVADQEGSKAFSYPGPPQPEQQQGQEGGPARGMSLPGFGHGSPRSPASGKRHKCPHCSTDFTRHHNLKSHLLTHSQEKPFVCQTCEARFRRLHDLKRHMKLHTGERPHTCEKCGRRFARGDALARHNKGPGGCAGRRSSFGGEDEYGQDGGGEGMDGIDYTGVDDEDDLEGHDRRESEPSRKRRQLETAHDNNREVYRQHSSTYPPAQHERLRGDMGPPSVAHAGSNPASSPRDASAQPGAAGGAMNNAYYSSGQVFAEPGMMTQSPKPLSPGQQVPDQHRLSVADASGPGSLGRNRSTSLTTQFQQAHFGRGSNADGRTPPLQDSSFASNGQQQARLPPLSGSGHHNRMSTGNSMPGITNQLSHQQTSGQSGNASSSNPGSLSSHGRSSGSSSMRDVPGHEQAPQADIWAYARAIETRFSRMQDEYELRLTRQQEEIIALKNQMQQLIGSYASDMGGGQRGPPPYPS